MDLSRKREIHTFAFLPSLRNLLSWMSWTEAFRRLGHGSHVLWSSLLMQPKQLPSVVSLGCVDPHLQREESMGSWFHNWLQHLSHSNVYAADSFRIGFKVTPAFTTDQSDRNRRVSPALALFQVEQGTDTVEAIAQGSEEFCLDHWLRSQTRYETEGWMKSISTTYISTGSPRKRHLSGIPLDLGGIW